MVTLLLTFFVLLISLAKMQDPERFNAGRDAFVRHIDTMGLGMLFGKRVMSDFSDVKIKYRIESENEEAVVRTIDAKEENLRRIYKKINRSMETARSQIVGNKANFSVTDISFLPGEAQLNKSAQKFLTRFAANLPQDAKSGKIKLYVVGLARDEHTEKKQWTLSAMRAGAVADFLKQALPQHLRSAVYSWGAGPGGCWVASDAPMSEQSQILIAVLREN
jgi:outer membrane protein OmpA-like peptidoglycan-associated protein